MEKDEEGKEKKERRREGEEAKEVRKMRKESDVLFTIADATTRILCKYISNFHICPDQYEHMQMQLHFTIHLTSLIY